jgi:hypothetical protein
VAGTLSLPVAAQGIFKPDSEGFIRNWLVLAPIPIEGDQGATEIDRDFLNGEATIRPKANDAVTVGGRSLTWKAHQTSDFLIDFRESFDPTGGEYVAGYAVAYVVAEEGMAVGLSLGTNDQGKVWLNGKEVFKFDGARTLDKDSDRVDVTLVKGQNVLIMKVVNEVNNWQGCARFMRGASPVTNLQISLTPE